MSDFRKRLANLLSVKSLVTLALTICFVILTSRAAPMPPEFTTIYTTIIGFYFGTQANKDK